MKFIKKLLNADIKKLSIVVCLFSISACSQIPPEAYYTRGQPESLLDVTSEKVNIAFTSPASADELTRWLDDEAPDNAIVTCASKLCDKIQQILDQYDIEYSVAGGTQDGVSLVYENIAAYDCDNRFISNHNNPYNLNHKNFGCSVAANVVMSVSDKAQFVRPKLLGQYDGEKATQNYDTYLQEGDLELETAEE